MMTLMVRCILYIADPLQMPAFPLVLSLTIYILFSFLAQISFLTQLHDPRPFALVFTLTLLFQILSFTSKIFLVLILLQLLYCYAISKFYIKSNI